MAARRSGLWMGLAVVITTLVLLVVLVEFILRAIAPEPAAATAGNPDLVAHEELRFVLNPASEEIDRYGFRNAQEPAGQQIFTIGDSQTFGENVSMAEAWPTRLGELTKLGVYNLSVPVYNIYQYYQLFEIAASHKPLHIVIGLHPANDIARNACRSLGTAYWKQNAAALGLNSEACAKFLEREESQSAAPETGSGFSVSDLAIMQAVDRFTGGDAQPAEEQKYFYLSRDDDVKVERWLVQAQGRNMDIRNKVVFAHFENSKILLQRMKRLADERNIRLSVLIIPSKQRVMVRWAALKKLRIPQRMRQPLIIENTIIEEYGKFLTGLGVPVSDASGKMADLLDENLGSGTPTFAPEGTHPLASGYQAYANAAYEMLIGQ